MDFVFSNFFFSFFLFRKALKKKSTFAWNNFDCATDAPIPSCNYHHTGDSSDNGHADNCGGDWDEVMHFFCIHAVLGYFVLSFFYCSVWLINLASWEVLMC